MKPALENPDLLDADVREKFARIREFARNNRRAAWNKKKLRIAQVEAQTRCDRGCPNT